MFQASIITFFLLLHFVTCWPQQMILNRNLGPTDPLGGYLNYNLDTDSIIIQRPNLGITTYHLVSDPNGYPVFTRRTNDQGKRFISFLHPSYPPGSGQFIILRKMPGESRGHIGAAIQSRLLSNGFHQNIPQIFYEAFVFRCSDSLHGSVSDLDPKLYGFMHLDQGIRNGRNKIRSKFSSLRNQPRFMK